MLNPSIPYHVLFQVESPAELEALAQQLLDEYPPRTSAQCQIWEDLVSASWLRRRYEKVRSNLFTEKNKLLQVAKPTPAQLLRLDQISRSIQTFHRELDRQKKAVGDCRRLLRRGSENFNSPQAYKLPQAA
jgi:hypothetical protein